MRTRAAIDGFLASRKARGNRPRTLRWYRGLPEPFCRLNPQLPREPGRLELFLGALSASEETRHGYFRTLRCFYRWACRRKLLQENPMDDVIVRRPEAEGAFSLTAAGLGGLLATPLTPRDHALVCLLVDTLTSLGFGLFLSGGTILRRGKRSQRRCQGTRCSGK